MVQPVGDRPIVGAEQGIQVQSSSFFTKEKITRLAIQTLSILAAAGTILLGACVVVGAGSAWHILSAFGLYIASKLLWAKASLIVDFNDPAEVERLRRDLIDSVRITKMLMKQSIDTIINHDLISLKWLRTTCYAELIADKSLAILSLREHADALLRHRVLTPELHRIIKENDLQALERLPRSIAEMEALFRAFDQEAR